MFGVQEDVSEVGYFCRCSTLAWPLGSLGRRRSSDDLAGKV